MRLEMSFVSRQRKRKGMALPLTLVILVIGAMLVATAFYLVQNMYSTSRQAVTREKLYNAAQTGIEQAKVVLWEARDDLYLEPLPYKESLGTEEERLDTIRVRDEDGNYLDSNNGLYPVDVQGIDVYVNILDCNYVLDGTTFDSLATHNPDQLDELPPQWQSGTGATGGTGRPPAGTSVIIDPSRNIMQGAGGSRRYVIRSKAEGNEQDLEIEVMVEMVVDD